MKVISDINFTAVAKFRNVSVKFWSDPFIESLTPEKKYFFLYLITNEHSAQCGIYEISFRQMAFETGYNQETVGKLVQFFEKSGKIKYSRKTNEIAIKNFVKHNPQGSPKVAAFVEKELKQVKDRLLIAYIYAMDTLSQEEEEETEEEEEEETQEQVANATVCVWPSFQDFWDKYDKKKGRPKSESLWKKISQGAREKIMLHLDEYLKVEKQYRKDPERYLSNKGWEDEVILKSQNNGKGFTDKREQHLNGLIEDLAERVIARNAEQPT